MFTKLVFSIAIVLLSQSAGAAAEQPMADAPMPYANVLNGAATATALPEANGQMAGAGCKRIECLALDDLVTAFDILLRRDVPNTMVRKSAPKGDPEKSATIALRQALLRHRDRYGDYCAALTKLAMHFDDYSVGFRTIEIATRLDAASPSARCAPTVLAALPQGETADKLIQDASETCSAEKRVGCAEIHRP